MKPELRKALNDFMRILPGWEDLTDDEIEIKVHEEIMNLKLIEPLDWSMCKNWRGMEGRNHILENDESFLPEFK